MDSSFFDWKTYKFTLQANDWIKFQFACYKNLENHAGIVYFVGSASAWTMQLDLMNALFLTISTTKTQK